MGEEKKKRGRKVHGEVWAVDLTAMDAEGRWLRYRDLKKILDDTMDWVSQVRKDEWMVKACYSIFSLHKQGDRQKGEGGSWEEANPYAVHVSHWHIHVIVWAADRAGSLSCGIEDTWRRLCKERGYRLMNGATSVKKCDDAGKVVYTLWQEVHGAFFSSKQSAKFKHMMKKLQVIFSDSRSPCVNWEVWRSNVYTAISQLTGWDAYMALHDAAAGDVDAKMKARELIKKRDVFDDVLAGTEIKRIVRKLLRSLNRQDVKPLLKHRKNPTLDDLVDEYLLACKSGDDRLVDGVIKKIHGVSRPEGIEKG
ncbi:hypothetical protein ACTNCI_12250 [Mitsuokella jalaludinii]|uniref:hypothetical protein n=1 Tax=Mitsuokella jalaludinii TaxID=187979 RepID=UPI003F8A33FC